MLLASHEESHDLDNKEKQEDGVTHILLPDGTRARVHVPSNLDLR